MSRAVPLSSWPHSSVAQPAGIGSTACWACCRALAAGALVRPVLVTPPRKAPADAARQPRPSSITAIRPARTPCFILVPPSVTTRIVPSSGPARPPATDRFPPMPGPSSSSAQGNGSEQAGPLARPAQRVQAVVGGRGDCDAGSADDVKVGAERATKLLDDDGSPAVLIPQAAHPGRRAGRDVRNRGGSQLPAASSFFQPRLQARTPRRVGAENCVTSCGLRIFTDKSADPVPPQNTHAGCFLVAAGPGAPGRPQVHARYTAGIPQVHARPHVRHPRLPSAWRGKARL